MRKLSLGTIARALDEMLDRQMTGQARIAAHLVAAAEEDRRTPEQIVRIMDHIVASTVLDELWITDESGHAYLTNVRGDDGELVPFAFDPDPAVQKQASKFYPLLSEPIESNAVVVQEAQNREIDWEIFKYVGVNGVDRRRIVQVGNALAFEEQGLLTDTYASPVMTAVLAAFGEYELLDAASTGRTPEVRAVFEAILAKQMTVHCILVAVLIQSADSVGWSLENINGRLQRVVANSPIAEIYVASHDSRVIYSSNPDAPDMLPRFGAVGRLEVGQMKTVDHTWEAAGDRVCKAATAFHPQSNLLVQVVEYFDNTELVSPRYVIPVTPGFGD